MEQEKISRGSESTRRIVLKDGRSLAYAEYGDPNGRPAFYFHGWPSSRIEAALGDRLGRERGVRLISPDRPGLGLSDFQIGRKLEDWPKDVCELADSLGLDRFTVVGNSGGAPYAAICGAKIPERVTGLLLMCGLGPTHEKQCVRPMLSSRRIMLTIARRVPGIAARLAAFGLSRMHRSESVIFSDSMIAQLPECDRAALRHSEWRKGLAAAVREAFQQGARGAAWEGCLYAQPWNFSLDEINLPVIVWHGEHDQIVPIEMGRYYANNIRGSRVFFYPDEGHFSLPFNRIGEIFDAATG